MKLVTIISDRDLVDVKIPRWYGIAYRRPETRYNVVCVIPLNLLARYGHKLYWLLYRWVKWGDWEGKLDDSYWRGFNDGTTAREHHYDRMIQIIKEKIK